MRKRDNNTWSKILEFVESFYNQIKIKDKRFEDPEIGIEEDG